MNYLKHLILIASMLCSLLVHAQPGSIDSTFNPIDEGFGLGNGANTFVFSNAVQQDGKVLIGGDFTSYGGFARNRIARLNTDGTLDTSFDVGTGANSRVNAIAVQADGKIIIGGVFTNYNGTGRNRIARLNADGSLDVSFNPGSGVFGTVETLVVLPTGEIMIGGEFTSYNGTPINRIARLNPDGSLDMSFNPGTGANNTVVAVALQADGKYLIGGDFTSFNNVARSRIARINTDGSLDTGFNPGSGTNGPVRAFAILADGKIIVGGEFTTYNGSARTAIARVNTNGSLDAGYNPSLNAHQNFGGLVLQADEKIVIGGNFSQVSSVPRLRVARLNTDGSLDLSFDPGEGANNRPRALALQPDGKIVMVGDFSFYDSTFRNRVLRILQDGGVDPDFNKTTGANSSVFSTLLQPDGKILIGGDFLSYNDTARARIARLNADGSLDNTFNPGAGANGTIRAIAVQSDGKVLIGGNFTNFDGVTRNRIARLNSDGSLDLSFNPGVGFNSPSSVVRAILVQSDGKIVVAGDFMGFNLVTRMRILRLNSNGSLDTGFASSGVGTNGPINAAAFQSDGKILIAGAFDLFGSDTRRWVARLNLDGSLDPSFNPGAGPNQTVNALAVQEDDKILIGGRFTIYNGTTRRRIARINTDGSLDATFDPGGGVEPSSPAASASVDVLTVAVRPDSIILLGGIFVDFDGVPRNRIAQLLADGSLDLDFDPGTGANGSIQSLSVQKNGRNIIGGTFTGYDGTGRNRIARVNGTPICLLQIEDVNVTDETCPGAGDATLTATASCASCENGSDDLRFSLDSLNFNNASGLFTNLPPDAYTVYITDINNPECISSGGPYVVQPGIDEEAPVIICPMNVTIGTDPGECTASNVALGTPTVTDNCNPGIIPTNDAPAVFQLGQTTVAWTADDGNGNMSTCTIIVTVEDMEQPVITCPSNVSIGTDTGECTASNVNLGTPVVTDNCNASIIPTNNAPLLFPKGITTVTWTADDGNGNISTCTISVTVQDLEPPVITCPPAVNVDTDMGECTASNVELGAPTVTDNCNPSIPPDNDAPSIFPLGQTTVTWTADDGNGNMSTCTMTVTVQDLEPPVIICPSAVNVGTDPGECTAINVALGTPTITDNCNQAITPGNDAPSIFPLGQTTVTWTADDGNGNMSSCNMTVTVQDLEAPVITCPSDVTVNTDAGECTASNVNLGTPVVTDNCNASIIPTNDAPLLFPPGTTTVTWTADDGNGNMNTCTMSVLVELIGAPCDFPVTGNILWEHNNAGVLEANVILSGDASDNALTDATGFYELLVSPGSYTLTPSKTDDLLNGVSVLDVLMIQEHVTLINPITDPYKLIAADVNESNSVSTLDALIIAQSILGNPVAISLFGDSWRFTDATHVFPMPESPWGFPESINLANVDEEISGLNFVGIKKGDINGSAIPNVWSEEPVNRTHLPARVVWQVMDRDLRLPGEEIEVVFRAGSFEEVAAYQFGLEYHAGNLELLDIIPGVLPELNSEHFRVDEHEEGHLRSLWLSMASPSVSLEQDAPVFTLRFRVKRSSNQPLSELIWLSEDVLPGEAYNTRHEQGQVSLEFTAFPVSTVEVPGLGGFVLYQNIPNPFEEQTRIGFYLPEASSARLRIFNAEGRALYHSEAFYPAGYQELLITDLPASGILYYHLETPNNSAVRKMVRH